MRLLRKVRFALIYTPLGGLLPLGIIACFSWAYAFGIFFSFWRAELAMFYWIVEMGYSRQEALAIAIACSTLSIGYQFFVGEKAGKRVAKFFLPLARFCRRKFSWFREFLAIHILRRLRLKQESAVKRVVRKFPYCVLLFFCFEPVGGTPSAVIFAKSLGLNIKYAALVFGLGNLAEKIIWSYVVDKHRAAIQGMTVEIICVAIGILLVTIFLKLVYSQEPVELAPKTSTA